MVAEIGIIGGTGILSREVFKTISEKEIDTPYGKPSGKVQFSSVEGISVAFLPRHGVGHKIPPHMVNYRANIFALKSIGVKCIIGLCAVGSLKEEIAPGHIVIPDQFIDFTKHRKSTYFDGDPVGHISSADPFCKEMRVIASKELSGLGIRYHEKGTYVCIEGPRFSTRAESRMWVSMADVIGMTVVPEVTLAMEQELCYLCLATVTDYDVWAEKPVSTSEVLETMAKNNYNVQTVLKKLLPRLPPQNGCLCNEALKGALIR